MEVGGLCSCSACGIPGARMGLRLIMLTVDSMLEVMVEAGMACVVFEGCPCSLIFPDPDHSSIPSDVRLSMPLEVP